MGNGPNLWWVYDSNDRSFSALPPGPMLVPALFIMALAVLFGSPRRRTFKHNAGRLAETPEWQSKHARYQELVKMSVASNGNLPLKDLTELEQLERYLCNPHGIRL
jgi:hypothetical protein